MGSSRGKRSLLRRQLRALGAALTLNTSGDRELTRESASQDATAGQARDVRGHGEAAIPRPSVRAPAVATLVVLAALCCVSHARADSGTPPPDPYKPPAKASTSKPKQTRPAVVHSAPVYHAPVRTYTPPAPAVRPSA